MTDHHQHAAELYRRLLIATDDDEAGIEALRECVTTASMDALLILIGALAGTAQDQLDVLYRRDEPERYEWIATRADLIAQSGG